MLTAFVLLGVATFVALAVRLVRGGRPGNGEAGTDAPMWPVVLVLAAVSTAPFLVHEHGWYVGDTQFLFNWNPQRAVSDAMSIWQTRADLGGNTAVGIVLPNAYLAVLRSVGLSAWLAQRVWFATLIAGGSIGTAYVARFFSPRTRIAALVAGLSFIAAPFTVAYFSPTWLFASAAACPWLVLSALRGTTTRAAWRWAAVPALVISASIFNPPAIFFAILPTLAALVYLRVSGRARWRAIVRWVGRVALFAVPAVAPLIAVFWFQRGTSELTLASTESVAAIKQSSTWAESLRGLGGWLTYWNPSGRLVLPYVGSYMTNWLIVVLTFVPVVASFVVVAIVPKRARLLFGAILVTCAAVMVGVFARDQLPPLGSALDHLYRDVPASLALRNVYKAGAGLALATAVLLGFGAEWVLGRWRSPWVRSALGVAGALVLVATSFPLWSGAILRTNQRLDGDVPAYWTAAMDWLDAQPGDGRVMVAPLSNVYEYRWGTTTNGDMFSSLLERPAVLGGVFPASSGDAGNLVQALSAYLSSGQYEPGTFTPIARRLGISYLVIRNDLDWQRTGVVRPAVEASLRSDPDLERVASFGKPGENTTSPKDHGAQASSERRLPPVEVFRVSGPRDDGPLRAVSNSPSLLVSGDGEAWPELAGADLLQRLGPVRYTGRIDRSTLRTELAHGASLAITDTNRRRSVAYGLQPETLPAADTDRVGDLFGRADSQTVATYGDASSIKQVGPGQLFSAGVEHGPWAAFDGDPSTTWLTGILDSRTGEGIEVRLRRPHVVSSLRIEGAPPTTGRPISRVRVSFDQGPPIDLVVGPDGVASATFAPRTIRRFTVSVLDVEAGGSAFGLADVSVGTLDLARRLQVPDDVARAARADAGISRSLVTAPTHYLFQRSRGLEEDAEPTMRRRFDVAALRVFGLSGTLQLGRNTPDAAVSRVVGGEVRAVADAPKLGDRPGHGSNAVDGDPATAWIAPKGSTTTLHLLAPPVDLSAVDVRIAAEDSRNLTDARVISNGVVSAPRSGRDCVPEALPGSSAAPVSCVIELALPGDATSGFELALTTSGGAVRVSEVMRNGAPNVVSASPPCRDDLLQIDGAPVGVTLGGTPADLRAGRQVPVTLCDPVLLRSGWHEVAAAPGVPLDTVRVDALGGRSPVEAVPVGTVTTSHSETEVGARLGGTAPAWLISGQAMSADWQARGDGQRIGRTVELDTQAGWQVGGGAARAVSISFSAQAPYRIALWLSFLALGAAYLVVVIDPKLPGRRVRASRPVNRRAWLIAFEVLAVAFAFGVGGALQALVVIGALVLFRRGTAPPTLVVLAGAALMVLVDVAVVPPYGPSLTPVDPAWPVRRGSAHFLALQAAVLLVAGMVGFARIYLASADPQADEAEAPPFEEGAAPSGEPDHADGVLEAPEPAALPSLSTRSSSTRQFQASTSRSPGTARIQRWEG